MTEERFWEIVSQEPHHIQDWVNAEIAKIRVYDYDCEHDVDWVQVLKDAQDFA